MMQFMNDTDFVPELMYQHVQFRRTEKFMKTYFDSGCVINQKMAQNSNKMLQEIQFMDKTTFRGETIQDEESRLIFKEGQGRITRPTEQNFCYYN